MCLRHCSFVKPRWPSAYIGCAIVALVHGKFLKQIDIVIYVNALTQTPELCCIPSSSSSQSHHLGQGCWLCLSGSFVLFVSFGFQVVHQNPILLHHRFFFVTQVTVHPSTAWIKTNRTLEWASFEFLLQFLRCSFDFFLFPFLSFWFPKILPGSFLSLRHDVQSFNWIYWFSW